MCKRRFLRPEEVEAVFNDAREERFKVNEVDIISTIVETAKRNGRIGDKVLLVIPPEYVHIPDWQRIADLNRAREIGTKYNQYKWEVPKVVYVNGKLIGVDGMHRLLGAVLAKIPAVVIEIMEITEDEAIDLFLSQTIDRNKMKPMDYYKASIRAGKMDYIEFRDICHKHNVQINGDDALDNPVGTFLSITEGVNINKELLDKILTLINKLKWNGTKSSVVYGTKIIRSLKKLYANHEASEKQMENILLQNCKGTEWFLDNLVDMPQYYIFDTLSKKVADNMTRAAIISTASGRRKATTA